MICQEVSSQTGYPRCVLLDQAGINMANYCRGRWVKVLMEVVTPQTGRREDSERHIIRGNALHCEGHVKRATSVNLSQTKQNTNINQQVSLR